MVNSGKRGRPRTSGRKEQEVEKFVFEAAVRYPNGSSERIQIRNALNVADARSVALDFLGNVLSLMIAVQPARPGEENA